GVELGPRFRRRVVGSAGGLRLAPPVLEAAHGMVSVDLQTTPASAVRPVGEAAEMAGFVRVAAGLIATSSQSLHIVFTLVAYYLGSRATFCRQAVGEFPDGWGR